MTVSFATAGGQAIQESTNELPEWQSNVNGSPFKCFSNHSAFNTTHVACAAYLSVIVMMENCIDVVLKSTTERYLVCAIRRLGVQDLQHSIQHHLNQVVCACQPTKGSVTLAADTAPFPRAT